jgi:predicted TIM-barrel fold metal-dependent hydrolase
VKIAMPDDTDLRIIDAHHHFWDLSLDAQPWLCREPMIPFRYGDYSAIRRNFLLPDYQHASQRHRVVATVTMEAEWREDLLIAETRWTDSLHRASALFPAAHITRTELHRPDVEEALAAQAAYAFVRGIRHKPAAAAAPHLIERGAPAGMTDPAWRRWFRALRTYGLHFELQAPWWHVDELIDLVAASPETRVVINHAFLPADRSSEGVRGWRAALKRAATIPNAVLKISGIGVRGKPWSLDDNRGVIRDCIDAFGPDRAMFGSNFPVDGLCGSFDTIYSGFKSATSDLPDADRQNLFHDTAQNVYRLAPA